MAMSEGYRRAFAVRQSRWPNGEMLQSEREWFAAGWEAAITGLRAHYDELICRRDQEYAEGQTERAAMLDRSALVVLFALNDLQDGKRIGAEASQ